MATLREITAQHEAGHAVTSIVLGWSIRYVTLRPHGGFAGVTWNRPPKKVDLLDLGAIELAGMAAECSLVDDRRFMVEGARSDLRSARDAARRVVYLTKLTGDPQGTCASWSEWDLGARMWHRARDLVAEYREAIDSVASKLHASQRAVSGSWIRDAVVNSPRCMEPPKPDEWWAPRYSRLRWVDAPK
jgi:ATP-dependent Zn protease